MNVVYIKTFENKKKYVGITNNFVKRMCEHEWNANNKSNLPVHRAINKYSHETEIVFESGDYDDVLRMEQIIIQSLKYTGYELYNLTNGGEGIIGHIHSKESKEKMRLSHLGSVCSEKTKQKMSKASKGKKKSKLHAKNIGKAHKGKKIPKEMRDKIREKLLGYQRTEESRKKQSDTLIDLAKINICNKTHRRTVFKQKCKKYNLNFEDYTETFEEWYIEKNGQRKRKYRYKKKGANES